MKPIILLENECMLAISKPAGVIVNKADTTKNVMTLQDWVEDTYKISSSKPQNSNEYIVDGYNKYDEFLNRSGIVHRLDKETSGVILIAKDVETFINLQNQFKSGDVKKIYTALVHGKVVSEIGEIDEPIGRLPWNRKRFGVLPEGRKAITRYKVIEYKSLNGEALTYLELYPLTGRTHQIRVHFQYLNHPLFGDELYAGRKQAINDRKILSRHFLHASKITLVDPKTGVPLEIASELPSDLSEFMDKLNKKVI